MSTQVTKRSRCPIDGQLVKNCPHDWCSRQHLCGAPDAFEGEYEGEYEIVGRDSSGHCKECRKVVEQNKNLKRKMARQGKQMPTWEEKASEWYECLDDLAPVAEEWLQAHKDKPRYAAALDHVGAARKAWIESKSDEDFARLTAALEGMCDVVAEVWFDTHDPSLAFLEPDDQERSDGKISVIGRWYSRPLWLSPPYESVEA
jgi:hypothetical protein